jgi:hypothetical protein
MMKWVRRMMGRWAPEALPPVVTPVERLDLARARIEQVRLLTRADEAIHEAMAHADEIFVTRDRRRKTRR